MMSLARCRRLGGLIVVLAALAAAPATQGQPQPARLPAALIVDMAQILQEAKAGKEVQTTINQQYAAYSKEVAQQEDELQKGGAELERQRTVLAPEVYNTRARELQQRYDTLGKSVQAKRQALQQSLNEAMDKVKGGALEVIADIVKERRADLVLQKQAVVFEAEGMDVTAEAVTRLDKKLPAVPVNLPKPEDGGLRAPPKK
jgi:Skp family chaperone for outer membrane proteins